MATESTLINGKRTCMFFVLLGISFFSLKVAAHKDTVSGSDNNFAIESYYRVKWGYADEFISLWKTNHYPLLKKALQKGDIISIKAERPGFIAVKKHGGILE